MTPNYQVIVDLIANMGMVVFPIALVFIICEKCIGAFLDFVSGSRRVKL